MTTDPDGGTMDGSSTSGGVTPQTDDGTGSMSSTGPGEGTDTGELPTSDDGSSGGVPEYAQVYGELCLPCHGNMGQGISMGTDVGPEILHPHPDLAAYLVRNGDDNTTLNAAGELVGHPGTMPAFTPEEVSDEVLDEIVAWLDSFPQPTTGQDLFADYCSFCHGMTGGTDVDYVSAYHNLPFLTSGNVNTLPEFIAYVRAGHVVNDMGVAVDPSERRDFMPPFGPEMLTDEELTLIEAWARQQ